MHANNNARAHVRATRLALRAAHPCISFSFDMGNPAFCASPSWFWFTHSATAPRASSAASTRCASVGSARFRLSDGSGFRVTVPGCNVRVCQLCTSGGAG